jgi:hypothetical protein
VVDSDFGTTPTLFNDASNNPMIAAVNKNGYVYAFNRTNVAAGPVWKTQIAFGGACPVCGDGSVSPGTFGGGRPYFAGGNTTINGVGYPVSVRALDPSTGNILWQHASAGTVFGALVYVNGLVIVNGGATIEVLDATTGASLFTYTTGGIIYSAPNVANGQIFMGSIDDKVYAFGLPSTPPPTTAPDPNNPGGWVCQDVGNPTPAGSESVSGGTWSIQAGGSGIGVVVQYRSTFGGGTTVDKQMPTAVPPLYLEIQRVGNQFQAATSNDGSNYTLLPGSTATVVMPTSIDVGLAVSSDNNSALSTATFDTVAIGAPSAHPVPTPSPTPCPNNWNCAAIGNPAIVGDQSLNGGAWTVKGSGVDIWNAADQFHFVWQSMTADITVSAQQLVNLVGSIPTYLMAARSGSTYSAYTSSDGNTWTSVAGSTVTLNMSDPLLAGLAVTSHNTAMSTVTLDTVSVSPTAFVPPGCLANWDCSDIGNPTLAGSQSNSQNGGTWTIQGAGGDIWGTSDQFHFVSQSLAGDGSVSVRIVSQTNTDGWAKGGVMLRQSNNPGSMYYGAFMTPSNGIVLQYRAAQGYNAQQLHAFTGTVPAYLMVARSGNTYTAYTSSDGNTWAPVVGSSITLNMSGQILVGLAVTSHNAGVLGTVTFDTVSISRNGCFANWGCSDIGNPALAGSQSNSAVTFTIQGEGGDIWETTDQFHFVWQSLAADGNVSARLVSQSNTDGWAKAGLMLRQSSDPGSPYYFTAVTPGNGITVQYRASQGGNAQQLVDFAGTVPAYLMVAR